MLQPHINILFCTNTFFFVIIILVDKTHYPFSPYSHCSLSQYYNYTNIYIPPVFLLFSFLYIDVMHVYAQLYATKYPINESMFVNSAMTNNRKMLLSNICNSSKVKTLL